MPIQLNTPSRLHVLLLRRTRLLFIYIMPALPQDIIDELAVVVFRDSGLKCLLTLGLVSKAFAVPVQAQLFRSVEIKTEGHCKRLLAVLRHNPGLRYPIQQLTIHHREPSRPGHRHLRDHSSDINMDHWIHSSDAAELLDLLTNVRTLTLYGLMSRQMQFGRLLAHSLRGRLQAVTELHLSQSMHEMSLNSLARLMLHFPVLETFSNDFRAQVNANGDYADLAPPDGWIDYTDSEGCTSSTGITDGGRHSTYHRSCLRRLIMELTGQAGSEFPSWFSKSERLSGIEDLQLHTHASGVSMYSTWDLVQNTASTLRTLILTIPYDSAGKTNGDGVRMQHYMKPLKAPHLTSVEIRSHATTTSLFLITDILSAMDTSESTPLQTIHLTRLALSSSDPGAFEMHFWHKLDEVTARWKDTLEKLVIDIHFEVDMDEEASRPQKPAEENKKINPPSEEDIRRGMVNTNRRGILDLSVRITYLDDDDLDCQVGMWD
jgi:hypothetical protein